MASVARDSHFETRLDAQLTSAGLFPPAGATMEDKLRLLVDGSPAVDQAPDPAEDVEDSDMDEETFKNKECARMAAEVSDSDEDYAWEDELHRRWQEKKKEKARKTHVPPTQTSSAKKMSADQDKKAAPAKLRKDSPGSSKGASSSGKRASCDAHQRLKKSKPSSAAGKAKVTLQSPASQNVDAKAKSDEKSDEKSIVLSQGLLTGIDLKLMQSVLQHDLDGNLEDDVPYPLAWLFEEWKRKFKVLYKDDTVESVIADDELDGIVSFLLPDADPSVIKHMTKKYKINKIYEHI